MASTTDASVFSVFLSREDPVSPVFNLDLSHLGDVISLLKRCSFPKTRWSNLGLLLGLLKTSLDAIKQDNASMDSRLIECLSLWLNRVDNVDRRGRPTFDSLSLALHEMEENSVADALDKEKNPLIASILLKNHRVHLLQSLVEPVALAKVLNDEKVFTDGALSNIISTSGSAQRSEALLATVKDSVMRDYKALETFAAVLRISPCKENNILGVKLLNDYKSVFTASNIEWIGVENVGNGSDYSSLDVSGSSSPHNMRLSSTGNVEIPIPQSMSQEFSTIRASYARMFFKVRNAFKKNPPPLQDMKFFLGDGYRHLRTQLETADSLSTLLRVIEGECSLIDIEILHSVIETFEIVEAENYVKEYEATITEFCSSLSIKLSLREDMKSGSSLLRCEMATYVFDWEPEEHKLKDIRDILSRSSGKLVKIKYIDTHHSITVTCSFPHCLTGDLITATMQHIQLLKENGLMKLIIGYYTVWENEEMIEDIQRTEGRLEMQKQMDRVSHEHVTQEVSSEHVQGLKGDDSHDCTLQFKERIALLEGEVKSLTKQLDLYEDEDSISLMESLTLQLKEEKERNEKLAARLTAMEEGLVNQESSTEGLELQKELEMYKKMNNGMSLEIEKLKSLVNVKEGSNAVLEQSLAESRKEIGILQEKISSLTLQLLEKEEKIKELTGEIRSTLIQVSNLSTEIELESLKIYTPPPPPSPNPSQLTEQREYISITKGTGSFGMILNETDRGPIIKEVVDVFRCSQLRKDDIILEVNGQDAQSMPYNEFLSMLRSIRNGETVEFLVLQCTISPSNNNNEKYSSVSTTLDPPSENNYYYKIVHLIHQDSGFGFSCKVEENDRRFTVSVDAVIPGGAADGQLLVGDQIVHINDISVATLSLTEVTQLITDSAQTGTLKMLVGTRTYFQGSDVIRLVEFQRDKDGFGFSFHKGGAYDCGLFVRSILENGAADRNGILEGDQIIEINGIPSAQMGQYDAVRLIGQRKSKISLIVRKSEKPKQFSGFHH